MAAPPVQLGSTQPRMLPSHACQAMVGAFDKVDFFVHCNRTFVLVEKCAKIRTSEISSTSPPGGNLVDGLPPAASFDFDFAIGRSNLFLFHFIKFASKLEK